MEQKVKKIPMRQCLGCNEHKPKREMLRVLRTPEGEVVLDLTGKKSGRGAYICPKASCLKKARKTRRIDRELNVTIDEAVYDEMERVLLEEFGD